MTKKEESPILRMTGFVLMSAVAAVFFWYFFAKEHGNTYGLCYALCVLIGTNLIALGFQKRTLWAVVPFIVAVMATISKDNFYTLEGCLAILAYMLVLFYFFACNPECEKIMKDWVEGIFAPEKEENA